MFSLTLLTFPRIIFNSAIFPHRVGQCALLAAAVPVRPQELAKLTLTPRQFWGIIIWGHLFLTLTRTILNDFKLDLCLENFPL